MAFLSFMNIFCIRKISSPEAICSLPAYPLTCKKDSFSNEYLNYQGKNYTVERLIPTPYMMRLNADIWASNTDQKLQILEQILLIL